MKGAIEERAKAASMGVWWLYNLIMADMQWQVSKHKPVERPHHLMAAPVYYCSVCDRVFGIYYEDNRGFEEYHDDFPKIFQNKKTCKKCRKEKNAEIQS